MTDDGGFREILAAQTTSSSADGRLPQVACLPASFNEARRFILNSLKYFTAFRIWLWSALDQQLGCPSR